MSTAVDWLLASDEPLIRYRARTWLLDAADDEPQARRDREQAPDGTIAATLLRFPDRSVHPYRKWWGLHWRLVALADLGLVAERPAVRATLDEALDRELTWIANPRHLDSIRRLADGLYRSDASMEGNAVYAASTFGHATDPRVTLLVGRLLEWQWPDGGWNCDRSSSGYRSSFHESWATAIGLATYHAASGAQAPLAAARRTAELLLEHHLFRTRDGRATIHPSFAALHWPAYWHYDLLAGLRVLRSVDPDLLADPRATPALDQLEALRLPDGRFRADRAWWQTGSHPTAPTDAVDWGRGRPSEALTLQALRVLKASGRI